MTSIITAKHQIGEIEGIRCTIIESGVTKERMEFLRDLLAFNNLEVKTKEDTPAEGSETLLYTIGVTDLVFNPVYAIYERTLRRPDGSVITPAYWRQSEGDDALHYWTFGKGDATDFYE